MMVKSHDLERRSEQTALIPAAPQHITIRTGELRDAAFIDHCQKLFRGHLGFLYAGTIEKKIDQGNVLVAVDAAGAWCGFVMGTTSYDRNDEVSRIDQIAVVPALQRKQLGGALLAEWIRRLPYGVRLICCWCAQDLREGRFWEQQGFVPLAFRAGGLAQNRLHIFWQRRCRRGDHDTKFWYPKETANGAMAAARLILPIPPGVDWKEAEFPRILPAEQQAGLGGGPVTAADLSSSARRLLPGVAQAKRLLTPAQYQQHLREKSKLLQSRGPTTPAIAGRLSQPQQTLRQPPTEKKPQPKNTLEHVAAARELRDRFLEQLNAGTLLEAGKYDPTRLIDEAPVSGALQSWLEAPQMKSLTGSSQQ